MNSTVGMIATHARSTSFRRLTFAVAAALSLAPLNAQTITPEFATDYSYIDLGQVPGVPVRLGGLTFKQGDPNTILIGGSANNTAAKIYSIGVVRDIAGHITGFSGTAVEVASAAGGGGGGIDGGLDYGPDGVLFYTSYPDNYIEQLKPGSTVSDKSISAGTLGVDSSVGSLLFVPPGFPGAGRLKILSYNATKWYDAEIESDGSGTFNIVNVGTPISITAANGPEGAIYVGAGNAGFANDSVLVSAYSAGKIVAYEVDGNGDPLTTTARDFMAGLSGAEGATVDPLTNDFLFSTFGGGDRVIVVHGFEAPPPPTGPILTTIWTGTKAGGDAVPGAGTDARIEAGSKFVKFGVPSVNDAGHRAFVASWVAPDSKGTGIFAGNTESLVVAKGDAAPQTSGLFSSFKDPMLNNAGEVAFIGKARGPGVTPADDTAIWSNAFGGGPLTIKAREGGPAPGVPDAVFDRFKSVALGDVGIAFSAFMVEGVGGVDKDNDLALWIDAGSGPVLVAREGQVLPEGTVKSFKSLLPGSLTRGHGNGVGTRESEVLLGFADEVGEVVVPADEPVVAVGVKFIDGTNAIYNATTAGLELVAKSGDQAPGYGPGVAFSKFGIPGPARDGTFAFLSKSKGPGVSGANGASVNVWDDTEIVHIVSSGDSAPGLSGATFKGFKNPASNSIGDVIIPAKLAGSDISRANDDSIWWNSTSGGGLKIAAREGDNAPGTANGAGEHALFAKFKSMALPEGGRPVFIARLLTGSGGAPGPGETTRTNDDGAWSVGPSGFPQLILREGQQYDTKTVKKITLLAAVSGSTAQTRAHNAARHLLMRVDFTDRSQAIVSALLPEDQTAE